MEYAPLHAPFCGVGQTVHVIPWHEIETGVKQPTTGSPPPSIIRFDVGSASLPGNRGLGDLDITITHIRAKRGDAVTFPLRDSDTNEF